MGAALNEATIILGIKRGAAMSILFTRRPGLREFGLNPPENPSDFCYKICHIYDYDDRESPILLEAQSIGGVWVSGWLALRSINSSLAAGVELHFKGRDEFRGILFGEMGMVSGQVCCILPKKIALTRATELAIKDEISNHLIDRLSGMIGGISFNAYQAGLQALIESDPGGQFSRLLKDGNNPFAQAISKAMRRHHRPTTEGVPKIIEGIRFDGESLNIPDPLSDKSGNSFLKNRTSVKKVEQTSAEIEPIGLTSFQFARERIKDDLDLRREERMLKEWFSKAFQEPSPNEHVSVFIGRPEFFRGFPAELVLGRDANPSRPERNRIEDAVLLIYPASDLMRDIFYYQPKGTRANLISTVIHNYAAWFAKDSQPDQYQLVIWREVSELVVALVESKHTDDEISRINEELIITKRDLSIAMIMLGNPVKPE